MNEENNKPYYPCGRSVYEHCVAEILHLRRLIEHSKGKLEALEEIKYDLENDWGFKESDLE